MNRRTTFALAGAAALALGLSACSSAEETLPGQSAGSSDAADLDTTLDMGLSSDISAPDPSSAYSGSEMNLVLAAYEGLLKYANGTEDAEIVPSLATDWTVSEDGLTYTFTLRDGVTFADGTPFTSAAVQPSVDRMLAEGASGPGYMVGGIASIDTPSDTEVVFTLEAPNDAFLDYLASPFGLKMISPDALAAHGDDAEWFAANSAGTGPFQYAKFDEGVSYELTANESYWGDTGGYESIEFHILDSTNTIQLQLESGELDGYIGSANKPLFDALSANEALNAYTYPSMMAPVVYLNPSHDILADAETRLALLSGVDWDGIVQSVYGDLGTTSAGVFPSTMVDSSLNQAGITYDADALAALAEGGLAGESITISYPSYVPGGQDIADNLAAQLNTVGIKAESVGLESSAYWSSVFDPEKAPDITLMSIFPDAAHPDTWARLLYSSEGGLNLFYPEIDGLDAVLDEAVETGDHDLYGDVTSLVAGSGDYYTVADLKVSAAFQASITGAESASYPLLGITFDFTQLSPGQ
ncbi:ABC transporter substrate-binding protein [Demequina gelatinilytica]|uniref:ABC transporter substrate-binding protein n=1 Tax=Demequina gelatinilytica TaxID=1638980 RepID=UPI00078353DC|nr:ABC transporter substrate-binding protein [Demequina gelatinilytica]